jgi:menaquinol-cytochrome c reductase iron-sulfur subunit
MATALGTCALAAATGGPAIALALAPLQTHGAAGRWVKTTLKLEQLKEGEARRVPIVDDRHDAWTIEQKVQLGSVWLIRRGDKVIAFSSVCPHLGCSVNTTSPRDPSAGFACPCHTSSFDASGKRTGGPSPRDLDSLETKVVEDGFVAVDFRRFRIGIEDKVET